VEKNKMTANCVGVKKCKLTILVFAFVILNVYFITLSCQQKQHEIMTVTGLIPAEQMGMTLAHEHVLVDFIGADSTGYYRWDKNKVIKKVTPYLTQAKEFGVKTLIECTPAYLGRDPVLLARLSKEAGLIVLTNTGLYGAKNNKFIPKYAFKESADELAERWINEWKNGIEDTNIRPGFIKIAVDHTDTLSTIHRKIVRAAAKTHLETGLTIVSHTGPEKPAFEQLSILGEEGVAPAAFVWTHAQRGTKDIFR